VRKGRDMRLFLEFSEYDDTLESRTYRPAGHEREFFFGMISRLECLHISGFHDRMIGDFIDVFLLEIVYDDLITLLELIEESKY
jgi:hypothetical protein